MMYPPSQFNPHTSLDQIVDKVRSGVEAKRSVLHNLVERVQSGDQVAHQTLRTLARQSLISVALYPGSFDGFTLGHLDLVERATNQFDLVIVGIGINPGKPTGLFSLSERIENILEETEHLKGKVLVLSFPDATIDVAQREGARCLIRGVRGPTDYPTESDLAQINREQTGGRVDTFMIVANQDQAKVSSSTAKQLVSLDLDTTGYLSPATARRMEKKLLGPLLKSEWERACTELGLFASTNLDTAYSDLLEKYSGGERHYHDIRHIHRMLQAVSDEKLALKDRASVVMMILWHDIVYDTKRGDNEQLSANAFESWAIQNGVAKERVQKIVSGILATDGHGVAGLDRDSQIFLDLDLAILASDAPRYDRYSKGIRKEYEWVPLRKYCLKRSELLIKMANRESLYSYPELLGISTEDAKRNLLREAKELLANAPKLAGPWTDQVNILTGQIGSGKSTVLELLRERGAYVVSADVVWKELIQPGSVPYEAIVDCFGAGMLHPDRTLNVAALADLVFKDPDAKKAIEEISFPAVLDRAKETFEHAIDQGEDFLVFEVPLFFEAGWDSLGFKSVTVLSAPEDILVERVIARSGLTSEQVKERLKTQLSAEEKILRGDFSIRNVGSLQELAEKVERVVPAMKGYIR